MAIKSYSVMMKISLGNKSKMLEQINQFRNNTKKIT